MLQKKEFDHLDGLISDLKSAKDKWAQLPVSTKIKLLNGVIEKGKYNRRHYAYKSIFTTLFYCAFRYAFNLIIIKLFLSRFLIFCIEVPLMCFRSKNPINLGLFLDLLSQLSEDTAVFQCGRKL